MNVRLTFVFILALLLAACAKGGDDPAQDPGGGSGGEPLGCQPEEAACTGNTLWTCPSGQWIQESCDDARCKQEGKGKMIGCRLDSNSMPFCECGCVEADNKCQGNTWMRCDDDGAIRSIACTDKLCQDEGYKGLDTITPCGKGSDNYVGCLCVGNCTSAENKCQTVSGKTGITYCDGKNLQTRTCDEVCAPEQAGSCGKDDKGTDYCWCGKVCNSKSDNYCGTNVIHFCTDQKVFVDVTCSDEECKKAGYTKSIGCGMSSSGYNSCLCE